MAFLFGKNKWKGETTMKPTTRKLTHSALMLALALLLSMIKFYHFPNGGSITASSPQMPRSSCKSAVRFAPSSQRS